MTEKPKFNKPLRRRLSTSAICPHLTAGQTLCCSPWNRISSTCTGISNQRLLPPRGLVPSCVSMKRWLPPARTGTSFRCGYRFHDLQLVRELVESRQRLLRRSGMANQRRRVPPAGAIQCHPDAARAAAKRTGCGSRSCGISGATSQSRGRTCARRATFRRAASQSVAVPAAQTG